MTNTTSATDTNIALQQMSSQATTQARGNLTGKISNPEEIAQAAEEFESVFIAEMLKPMFEGLELEEPFGGGKGEEVFQSFLLQEYGKITARSGGIGIANKVKQELIKLQEHANA